MNKIRIILLLSLIKGLVCSSNAATITVDKDNIRYTVDTEAQTAELYGAVSSSTTITNLVIPDFIEYNNTQIPVISIRGYAFSSNKNLRGSLTIGNNVETIDYYAFSNCTGFTGSLTIGNNVQTIGDWAFYGCTGFTGSLTIPDSVQTIGKIAFYGCTGFTGSLTIGNKVQKIGDEAFHGCSGFTGSLAIGDNVQTIGTEAFFGCSGFTGSLTIPDNVQSIGNYAFSYCSGFTGSLTILNSVQTIGNRAFYNCSGFTGSLVIGDNVQTIGSLAFDGCIGLTSLYLPASIKSFESAMFYDLPLKEVTCLAETPPNIESATFSSSTMKSACLYVPSQSVSKYQSANYWKNFNCINKIKVLPTSLTVKPTETTIGVGEILDLEIIILPKEAEDADLIFTSSNIQVANVDEDGIVTALSEGKTTITIETENGLKATCVVTVIPVRAEAIKLSSEHLTLLVGQTDKLTATVTPENTTDKTITWKSDNKAVATVGTDGTVTALSVGIANIMASCGDVTATCKVTVYGPDDVTVKPGDGTNPGNEDDTPGNNTENGGSLVGNDLTLRVNQSAAIDLVIPEGLSFEPKFAWTLDSGGAEFVNMTVNDNTLSATFKGLKVGHTGYTVSIVGVNGNIEAVKGKITVIEEIPVTSLELDPTSITMAQNALSQTIKTVYTPENASMPEFNWTSSVPTVATVDQNGVVTPVAQSQTVITCTALDGSGLSATCTVTVTAPIDEDFEFDFDESVMGGKEGISLYLGDTYQFTPKAKEGYVLPEIINWTSSDEKTVSVNSEGLITALALGQATITASATVNGKEVKATCEVTVIPVLANKVIISSEDLTLLVGQTNKLTATVIPENTTDKTITWKSDNEAVATVGADGTVTAISVGVANITVTCGDATATCKVSINPILATSISIDGNDIHILKETETLQLTVAVIPEDATYQEITWTSSDESKAIVSTSGLVTAIEKGNVEIIATLTNQQEVSASYEITIQKRLLGDANDNGVVNVADVGTISDYIVEKPVYNFCFVNADVITDGRITTADVTATVDIIFNDTPSLAKFARARKISAVGNNELIVDNFNSFASSIVEVNLNNPSDFTGLQGSILIPEGVTVRNVKKGAGASNHILNYNVTDHNTLEFILYSLHNATFEGMGSLLELEIQAGGNYGDLSVDNILASDTEANEYSLSFTGGKNNDLITSLERVDNDKIKIYSGSEGIVILNAQGENVNIFNMAGERIISTNVKSNKEYYPLTNGIYIVTVKTKTAKLIVK